MRNNCMAKQVDDMDFVACKELFGNQFQSWCVVFRTPLCDLIASNDWIGVGVIAGPALRDGA